MYHPRGFCIPLTLEPTLTRPSHFKHGQVPSIRYTDSNFTATVIESSVIPQFLADMFPSRLLPLPDSSPTAPLFRVRMAMFVHAFSNSMNPKFFDALFSPVAEVKAKSMATLATIRDEIEPLLHDAGPFFGGSERMTMAEVMTAPFVLRLHVFCKAGILPEELGTGLAKLEKYSKWAERVIEMESVMGVWDEEFMIGMIRGRIEEARAAAAATRAK